MYAAVNHILVCQKMHSSVYKLQHKFSIVHLPVCEYIVLRVLIG